jgi:hypothetical protein
MSVMPSLDATAWAVVRLSKVNITMRTPSALRVSSAARVVALIGIGHRDDTRRSAVNRNKHRGRTLAPKFIRPGFPRGAGNADIVEELGIADGNLAAVDHAHNTLTRDGREVANVLGLDTSLLCRRNDRRGKGCSLERSATVCTATSTAVRSKRVSG